jgi:uncharacterized membrane protein YjjP (DUF1212 family)
MQPLLFVPGFRLPTSPVDLAMMNATSVHKRASSSHIFHFFFRASAQPK